LQQIILADHAVAVVHEKGQQIEGLGFDGDQLGAATQFPALDVEPVVGRTSEPLSPPGDLPTRVGNEIIRRKKARRKAFAGVLMHLCVLEAAKALPCAGRGRIP
jgi:hypothetical protein